MRLYVFPDDDDFETRFLFKNVTIVCDSDKDHITFCPFYAGPDRDIFEAVKKALIDYCLPF